MKELQRKVPMAHIFHLVIVALLAVCLWAGTALADNAAQAPAAPQALAATPGDGELALTWQADADAEISTYLVSTDGGATWTTTGSARAAYTVRGLTNGQTYSVQVRAANGAGTGPITETLATPATPPPEAALSPSQDSLDFLTSYEGARPGPRPITVTNSGNVPITLTGFTLDGDKAFEVALQTPAILQPGESLTFTVKLTPSAVANLTEAAATLYINYDASTGQDTFTFPLYYLQESFSRGGSGNHTYNLVDPGDEAIMDIGFVQHVAEGTVLYAGPGTSYGIQGTVGAGTTFSILQWSSDSLWAHIRLGSGEEGWLHLPYVGDWAR